MELDGIILKRGKEKAILRRHPWIFSGAVHQMPACTEGDTLPVLDANGSLLGHAHIQDGGSILAKMVSFGKIIPDKSFWTQQIKRALSLRQSLGLFESATNNIFRLIHGEGDGFPGLVVDYYNGVIVFQSYSWGMHLLKPLLAEIFSEVMPMPLKAIYDKSSKTMPAHFEEENQYLLQPRSESIEHIAYENGHPFNIDWINGQKTGFFIDQRDNRQLLGAYAKDKKILNTFCYSGGFSIYALNNGAKEVHSLDSSQGAIDLTDANVALGQHQIRHKSIVADAMDYIKNNTEKYDIIILDPPAFAKHLSAKNRATKAYQRLNQMALKHIKPGGMLFTFSCSQVIDYTLFRNTITAAAIEAGRDTQIINRLFQPADHPVSIFHPEGEYLKGLALKVD